MRFIPAMREQPPPLDWLGFALAGGGLAPRCSASRRWASISSRSSLPIAALVLGLARSSATSCTSGATSMRCSTSSLFRLATYRAGVLGGSLFRIGIGATPFLLPLMLQLGFGLSPVQSGLLTFVSAMGAIFMKTLAARMLKALGFRRVLVWNALLASAMLVRVRVVPADDAASSSSSATLLVSGCCRSLQFTSLNAISYADVDSPQMGQASSLSGMLQQLSLSLGVAIGGYSLEIFGALGGSPGHRRAQFLLGVRRGRADLGELGLVGVAVAAAMPARRWRGARARHAGGGSEHRGAAGGLSDST